MKTIIVFFFLFTVCSGRWWFLKSRAPKVEHDCEHGVEKQTVDDHKTVFATFDKDGDGVVTAHEVVDASHRIQFKNGKTNPVDLEVARIMIREGDKDKDGTLSEKEWIEMFVNKYINSLPSDKAEEFKEKFQLLDRNASEGLTIEEVEYVITQDPNIKNPKAFTRALFDMYECDGDGKMSFREFLGYLVNMEIMERRYGKGTPAL